MLYIKNAKQVIAKNPTISIIVIIQLMIAIMLLNAFFIVLSNQNVEYRITKKLLDANGGFLMSNSISTEYSVWEDINTLFSNEINILGVRQSNLEVDGKSVYVQAVADELFDYIDMRPAKGRLPRGSEDDNLVEVIASFGKLNSQYNVIFNNIDGNVEGTLKIVGTTSHSFPYFDLGASNVSFSTIFRWGKKSTDNVILCRLSDFERIAGYASFKSVRAVMINNDVPAERSKEIENYLFSVGWYTPFGDIANNSQDSDDALKMFQPFMIIILLLAASNYAMSAALSAVQNQRTLAIMYLTGARRIHLLLTAMVYGLILSFSAAIPIAVIINFVLPSLPLIRGSLRPLSFIALNAAALGVFMGITILLSTVNMRSSHIADNLRRG